MKPYAELLEFNQPNPIRKRGFTRIRDAFALAAPINERIEPGLTFELTTNIAYDPERIMEFAGRWDYGENNARKLGETVTRYIEGPTGKQVAEEETPIIRKYIGMGHESMIEMGDATFFIECSRVVSHELVRHRIASFQQESQRFVKYDQETPEELFFVPPEIEGGPWEDEYRQLCADTLTDYRNFRESVPPQIARYVFPNATRTRLIMKTNIREWRHILRLRLDKSAQPEMQVLAQQIYDQLVDVFPNAMAGVLDGGRGVR